MKKSIIMTIIVAMVLSLVSFASVVNAADSNPANVSISAKQTSFKKGDTVTVTLNSDKELSGARLTVQYDQSLLKFTGTTPKESASNTTENGTTFEVLSTNGAVKQITITFEVIGTEGNTNITAQPIEFVKDTTTTYDVKKISGTVSVKISKPTTTPTTPTKPSTDTTPTKPATNSSNSTNSTSKAPTKYPSTGYSVIALGASVVAIIALGAISVKVFKK